MHMKVQIGAIHHDGRLYTCEGSIDGEPIYLEGRFAEPGDNFEGFRCNTAGRGASDTPHIPEAPPAGWREAERMFAELVAAARLGVVTLQLFGGQRPSLGRRVFVKPIRTIVLGDIFGIEPERDEPMIEAFGSNHDFRGKLRYHHATRLEDLATMPHGSWCWPPRV
jgi:hypothetical protein